MPHSPLNYIVLDLDRQEELQTNGQGKEGEEKGEEKVNNNAITEREDIFQGPKHEKFVVGIFTQIR
jgi:hypothetical protein